MFKASTREIAALPIPHMKKAMIDIVFSKPGTFQCLYMIVHKVKVSTIWYMEIGIYIDIMSKL